jgi:cytochrome P450
MAVLGGKYEHNLNPGTWLSVPHALLQHDPSIVTEAERFIPDRFIEVEKESGCRVARYGE